MADLDSYFQGTGGTIRLYTADDTPPAAAPPTDLEFDKDPDATDAPLTVTHVFEREPEPVYELIITQTGERLSWEAIARMGQDDGQPGR